MKAPKNIAHNSKLHTVHSNKQKKTDILDSRYDYVMSLNNLWIDSLNHDKLKIH